MKGDLSKKKLTKSILDLYPNNAFVQDKNIYINFRENGENVQLKIGITMPKQSIEFAETVNLPQGDFDWSDAPAPKTAQAKPFEPAEITQKETDTVKAMLERAGL